MPDLTFSTKGNAAVLQAYDAINKAQSAAAKGAGQVNEKLKLTEKECKSLDALQTQIAKRNESAAQTYVRKLQEVRRALAGHRDEAELLRKETTRLTVEYARQADAGKRSSKGTTDELGRTKAQASYLEAQIRKLPPLLNESEREAREFRGQLDLGTFAARRTKEEILGIKGAQSGAFGASALASLGSYAGGLITVFTATREITKEMEAQQQLVDKRTEAQLTVGEGRNILLRTLTDSSDAEIRQAMNASRAIASETGVSEARIAPALGDAISAIGGNVPKAVSATRIAAQYMAGSPDEILEFAGSLLDVSKATGTSDAVTNMGLYQLLGKISRTNAPVYMQQSIPSSLQGTSSFGSTYQEGGALFAALSDKTGRTARTATVRLTQQMDNFFARQVPDGDKLSFNEQLDLMWKNPEWAAKFFRKKEDVGAEKGYFGASFEAKQLGNVRQLLLDPNSVQAKDYRSALAQIPDLAGLRQIGQAEMGKFSKYNSLEPVAQRSRALSSGLEQLQVDAAKMGQLSMQEREKLKLILMESGFSGMGARYRDFTTTLGNGGTVDNEDALALLRQAQDKAKGYGFFRAPANPGQPENFTPEQQRTIAGIEQAIRLFEQAERSRDDVARQTLHVLEQINLKDGGIIGGNE